MATWTTDGVIARKEIVVIGGKSFLWFAPVTDESDTIHHCAASGGIVKDQAGWYLGRQISSVQDTVAGPYPTLRAACEATGVTYPGVVTHRSVGHRITGDLERVIDVETGGRLD